MDSEVAELITNTQSITNLKEAESNKDIAAYNAEDQMVRFFDFYFIFNLVFN